MILKVVTLKKIVNKLSNLKEKRNGEKTVKVFKVVMKHALISFCELERSVVHLISTIPKWYATKPSKSFFLLRL